MQIESNIQGIPCLIEVTTLTVVKPWRGCISKCPSSDDYYGYSEVEFVVLDRKGYKAAWLERKITADDKARIETEILEYEIED
jgi:hypothetical protein